MKKSQKHYSTLKLVLRIATLAVAIWALVIAYQAKEFAKWVDSKQEVIIEKLLFKDSSTKF